MPGGNVPGIYQAVSISFILLGGIVTTLRVFWLCLFLRSRHMASMSKLNFSAYASRAFRIKCDEPQHDLMGQITGEMLDAIGSVISLIRSPPIVLQGYR